jgi:lipopolysaccharide/colanic/teichoic acid biosynthesis glycosyltransferase/GGDEF domain-containing protein
MILVGIFLLAFPDFSHERFLVLAVGAAAIYAILSIVLRQDRQLLHHATELAFLLITVAVVRGLSNVLLTNEEDYYRFVTGVRNRQILSVSSGKRKVNEEINRLRRYNRKVSLVYCTLFEDHAQPYLYSRISVDTIGQHIHEVFHQRRNQVQLGYAISSLIYKSDTLIQHGEAYIICLPETNEDEAQKFVERIRVFVRATINANVLAGIATHPADGGEFDHMLDVARSRVSAVHSSAPPVAGISRRGDVIVDIEQRLEIEQKAEWLDKFVYQSPSSKAIYRPIKRLEDIVVSLLALVLLSPALAMVALAVYVDDRRPIFYMQNRTGYGGKRFKMFKFRTMYRNAPAIKPEKIVMPDGRERYMWPEKTDNDPRITRVGRILRKTSLDELPQLLNVLVGDMSLIGPRPTTWDVSQYTLYQTERLTVQPGITGLWQVSARETQNPDERLLWDLKYVEKMSPRLDIQLLGLTALQVIKKKGH